MKPNTSENGMTTGKRWRNEVEKESPIAAFLVFALCIFSVVFVLIVFDGAEEAHASELTRVDVLEVSTMSISESGLSGKVSFTQWKVKNAKKYVRSYDRWKANMTKKQRKSYRTDISRLLDSKTEAKAHEYIDKCVRLLERAKLCRYIDARGYSNYKVAFVKEWGKRDNKFLKGSPMAGTGYIIAHVAYNHRMDPRLYPAIADVESGRGVAPYGNQYNVCGWVWNPPAMYSWEDAAEKWHSYFQDRFQNEWYPISSMHGYGGYGPGYVNERMARI